MYINVSRESCADTIHTSNFINAIEIENFSAGGQIINKNRVMEILKICKEIRYFPDDLILTYDIYFEKKLGQNMVRVLLTEI